MTREYFMLHMDQDALVNTRLDHIVLGNEGCALQAISPEVVENISFCQPVGDQNKIFDSYRTQSVYATFLSGNQYVAAR